MSDKASRKNNGYSLLEIVLGIGILGIIATGMGQMFSSMTRQSVRIEGLADEQNLKNEISLILKSDKNCRISFAGNGPEGSPSSPVTFKKKDRDEVDEGVASSLWLANQAGDARQSKVFDPADSAFNKFGKLRITKMNLIFDNGVGFNYDEMPAHEDLAHLLVEFTKTNGTSTSFDKSFKVPVSVKLSTDSSKVTTILGCQQANTAATEKKDNRVIFTLEGGWGRYWVKDEVFRLPSAPAGGYAPVNLYDPESLMTASRRFKAPDGTRQVRVDIKYWGIIYDPLGEPEKTLWYIRATNVSNTSSTVFQSTIGQSSQYKHFSFGGLLSVSPGDEIEITLKLSVLAFGHTSAQWWNRRGVFELEFLP